LPQKVQYECDPKERSHRHDEGGKQAQRGEQQGNLHRCPGSGGLGASCRGAKAEQRETGSGREDFQESHFAPPWAAVLRRGALEALDRTVVPLESQTSTQDCDPSPIA
jgi:hypothetical protein